LLLNFYLVTIKQNEEKKVNFFFFKPISRLIDANLIDFGYKTLFLHQLCN